MVLHEILHESTPHLADKVYSYRGGYIAEDRRRIESDFFNGSICGISATNALELGIDVGHIDVTLHLGFPKSPSSIVNIRSIETERYKVIDETKNEVLEEIEESKTFFEGIYDYPVEIQALFFMEIRSALVLLKHDTEVKEFVDWIVKRLHTLSYHMRSYFWLDFQQLNDIYLYKTEEYSHTAVNKFNVIPEWVFDFMPTRGGYFIGNVNPARMDFRWFALGNCTILSSLATPEQASAIMDLIEERWEELVGEMPLKINYPAIESHEWRIVTGCDPKNTVWSYHNGGSCQIHFIVLAVIYLSD
ncbi:Alkaline neutral invertase [Castilleja foliolosa]|uniref:Alkaline/neutral invertase n=1 Tax=Castilleja foliolosa TaxID=1961234 RepID=A0ABD3DGR0_9LAMI